MKIVNVLLSIFVLIAIICLIEKEHALLVSFFERPLRLINAAIEKGGNQETTVPPTTIAQRQAVGIRSTPTPTPKPADPMPAALKSLIASEGEEQARAIYGQFLKTAKQYEVHGTVRRHLSSGHLFLTCFVSDPVVHAAHSQTATLWGFPNANALADGDILDCFCLIADPMKLPDGSMVRELIYVDAGGRWVPHFERSVYP